MQVSVSPTLSPDARTVAVLLTDGAEPGGPHAELIARSVERGEARSARGHVTHVHDGDTRVVIVGAGAAGEADAEVVRVAAAHAVTRAGELGARDLAWVLPAGIAASTPEATAALVEGTLLRAWRYDAARKATGSAEDESQEAPARVGALTIAGGDEDAARAAEIVARAANWARTQQHEPPNVLTPQELGARARAIADELQNPHLEIEVQGRAYLEEQGMGALLAVSSGSVQEPALITARYRHPGAQGPRLALVGKAVTFDSGGISIKPAARMHEMKFDMTGGAVVLGALRAVAELGLPLDLTVVVGATENLPSGTAFKPGDIITAADGTTIEITNTDAEGRLVLADCLWHARREGAETIVDVATLTGAVVVALGSTHAGLVSNADALAGELLEAGTRTGELAWRLPLHPEYAKLMNSPDADLVNGSLERKAGTITGGYFLSRFAEGADWAHLDIAGTAWGLGRAYAPRGGSAYGLRLLVDWLRSRSA